MRRGSHPSSLEGADVGEDVAGVPEAVLAGDFGRPVTAVVLPDHVGELGRGDRLAAADVEDPAGRPVVLQHQHVGVDHVVDVDVVPDRPAVLVQGRRQALQVAQAEDAAGTGVHVVHRLPGALDDAVAQGDGRYAVAAAEVDGHHLLAELGHPVGVLRIRYALGRGLERQRAAALGAGDVPLPHGQGAFGPHSRQLRTVLRAQVQPLAHGRLRRRHHDAGDVEALGHDDLVEQGRRDHVDVREPREVGQVVLVGGEVVDRVGPPQEVGDQLAVAGVALVEVDLRAELRRLAGPVYRRGQRVEDDDVMAERDQAVTGV